MLAQVASMTFDVMNFDNLNFLWLYFFFFLTANFTTPEPKVGDLVEPRGDVVSLRGMPMSTFESETIQRIAPLK